MSSRRKVAIWFVVAVTPLAVVAATVGIALGLEQPPDEKVVSLGETVGGRKIEAVRLGDPNSPNKAVVVGVIHGDEPAGLQVTAALRRSFADIGGVDLWVIDAVNLDGLARGTRGNAHGVDLNRNFPWRWRRIPKKSGYYSGPGPLSEPEAKIVADLIESLRPRISIWYHQPWNAVLRPCGKPAPVQRRYAALVHMKTSCRAAVLPGTAINWQNHEFPGTTGIVVELAHGKLSPAAAERHARAVAEVTASASS